MTDTVYPFDTVLGQRSSRYRVWSGAHLEGWKPWIPSSCTEFRDYLGAARRFSVIPVVAFFESCEENLAEFFFRYVGKPPAQALDKQRLRKRGKLKGFQEPLLGCHPSKHIQIATVVRVFLGIHATIPSPYPEKSPTFAASPRGVRPWAPSAGSCGRG